MRGSTFQVIGFPMDLLAGKMFVVGSTAGGCCKRYKKDRSFLSR